MRLVVSMNKDSVSDFIAGMGSLRPSAIVLTSIHEEKAIVVDTVKNEPVEFIFYDGSSGGVYMREYKITLTKVDAFYLMEAIDALLKT